MNSSPVIAALLANEKQQQQAALKELHALTSGNPGSLFACLELDKAGLFALQELVPLLQALGLKDSAFYLLHKEFGGKDATRTSELLRELQADPKAEATLQRGGERRPIVDYCIAKMNDHL